MSAFLGWVRRQTTRVVALVLLITMYQLGQLPSASADEFSRLAGEFDFSPMTIAMPAGLPTQEVRRVNQSYDRIPGWISSVGASVAMNDLTGDGLANDLCLTDPRLDEAIVTPAPVAGGDRYEPFVLDPGPLPIDYTMAPMGCVPGDFNRDGRMDLLVYYWGRTPIIFLARADATELSAEAFRPVEMVDGVSAGGVYTGPQWNTNAIAVADFDGDGREDIFVGNFWPHGPVLDHQVSGGVAMPASLSYALNGGTSYLYRWADASAGSEPTVSYQLAEDALPGDVPHGWVLAAGAVDLDGDQLPELYIAHDFGLDRLLHNQSTPGNIEFVNARGTREPLVPKSKVLGRGSFKGMGVDIADLTGDGMYDIFVSNITTSYGIQESNFTFINTAEDRADLRAQLASGVAPFEDRSAALGTAWSGWGWDVKTADLNNSGDLEILQTNGFIKGRVNRWPQMQEMATTNDSLVSNPYFWPHLRHGDDVAGDQTLAFFVKGESGRYLDLSAATGLAVAVPTRGVAVGDATGDGRLDFAVARQWDEAVFYQNTSPAPGDYLSLRLRHEPDQNQPDAPADSLTGSPVVGAEARVTTADGRTFVGQVDGGSGHGGKRHHNIHIGLGEVTGPLTVELTWRDGAGQVRQQTIQLEPGQHTLQLGERAEEVTS